MIFNDYSTRKHAENSSHSMVKNRKRKIAVGDKAAMITETDTALTDLPNAAILFGDFDY